MKTQLLLIIFLALMAGNSYAQIPAMVKNINVGGGSSNPNYLTNINGTLFFSANDGINNTGIELWKSDGTINGTALVKDIKIGGFGSNPQMLTNVNGTLYFTANDTTTGTELWKSDGTALGTVLVKDIIQGNSSSKLNHLTNVNGTLFFTSDNGNGYDIWKSDGTNSGTILLSNICTSCGSALYDAYLCSLNGVLFFLADYKLWKSDGTSAGTEIVKTLFGPGPRATGLVTSNGKLFFKGESNTGYELWISDGTTSGTKIIKDINTITSGAGAFPTGCCSNDLVDVNGILFFAADNGTNGAELWKSDGTTTGTEMVKDIYSGNSTSIIQYDTKNMHKVNNSLFFEATDGVNKGLFKSDGTESGTVFIKKFGSSGTLTGYIYECADVNDILYFNAYDDWTHGDELWKSDGTVSGTALVLDIYPGNNAGLGNAQFTNVNGVLFFVATDGVNGTELWALKNTTGMQKTNPSNDEISIYPNPNSGTFTLKLNAVNIPTQIKVINAIGETVYSETIKNLSKKEINLSHVPAGVYSVHVIAGEKNYHEKIVIE